VHALGEKPSERPCFVYLHLVVMSGTLQHISSLADEPQYMAKYPTL
jgi:hypothetical protein